jgi:hypothetical protein
MPLHIVARPFASIPNPRLRNALKKKISLIHFVVVGELRDRYGLRLHLNLSDGLANRFQTLVEAKDPACSPRCGRG